MSREVRLRFPPSPTGYLHIGGARTAIYNWLYAKKNNGKLVLRIENTDAERSTQESIEGILDGLKWLGITWDEGPYFQTDFSKDHLAAVEKLMASGHAYKCFCTREELEARRESALAAKQDIKYNQVCRKLSPEEIAAKEEQNIPYVIRFKAPEEEGVVVFDDKVYGRVERAHKDIEDFVIVRSNGKPLYLLCNVVDDIRDRISHIIRGQDGLTNTPRQILLYQALGAEVPVFAHMPLTLDLKKAKISKRSHGEIVAVQYYREKGFLSWALTNFLVLLGWSTSDDQEIFSEEELLEAFTLEGINRANSIFNYRKGDPKFFTDPKAININAHYLRSMPIQEIAVLAREEMIKEGVWDDDFDNDKKQWFIETLDMIRARYHTLKDFSSLARPYFTDEYTFDAKPVRKNILKHPDLKEWLPQLADLYEQMPEFTLEKVEKVTRAKIEELDIKPGILINGIRAAITGQLAGAGLFDIVIAIGKDRVVKRLKTVAKLYEMRIE
jgi:glutamyl-tRNA synthetase